MKVVTGQRHEAGGDGDVGDRILDAATMLFSRHGFAGTSTSDIAAGASTSKRALYAVFGSKHAILERVFDRFIQHRFDEIGLSGGKEPDSRSAIVGIARKLAAAATDDITLAMYRVLVAEIDRFPHMSDRGNHLGLQRTATLLEPHLGDLGIVQREAATHILYDLLVLAPLHRRLVKALDAPIDVERIVDIVLSGAGRAIPGTG